MGVTTMFILFIFGRNYRTLMSFVGIWTCWWFPTYLANVILSGFMIGTYQSNLYWMDEDECNANDIGAVYAMVFSADLLGSIGMFIPCCIILFGFTITRIQIILMTVLSSVYCIILPCYYLHYVIY